MVRVETPLVNPHLVTYLIVNGRALFGSFSSPGNLGGGILGPLAGGGE